MNSEYLWKIQPKFAAFPNFGDTKKQNKSTKQQYCFKATHKSILTFSSGNRIQGNINDLYNINLMNYEGSGNIHAKHMPQFIRRQFSTILMRNSFT